MILFLSPSVVVSLAKAKSFLCFVVARLHISVISKMRNNIYGAGGDGVFMGETYRHSRFYVFLEKVTHVRIGFFMTKMTLL